MANDDTCKRCFANDCNNKIAFAECVVTEGEVDIAYKPAFIDFVKMKPKVCQDYNDKCFILLTERGNVIRDCFKEYVERNELPITFLTDKYKESVFEVCREPLCNNHVIQKTQCITCDSRSDNNCFNTTLASQQLCPLEVKAPRCFHFEGDYIQRGCMAHLDVEKRKLCESNSDNCKKCTGNACNSRSHFQTCLTNSKYNQTNSKLCTEYSDECFLRVSGDSVQRGCMNDLLKIDATETLPDCNKYTNCEKCSGTSNCNDRQIEMEYCVECSTRGEIATWGCIQFPNDAMSKRCPLNLNKMGCYLWNDIGNVDRGCMSRLDVEQQRKCERNNKECKVCQGDNCNLKIYFQTCFECNSSVDGEDCAHLPSNTRTRTCQGYYNSCYMHLENGVVTRNCTGDDTVASDEECEKNPDACQLCSNSDVCNNKPIEKFTCVSCNSTDDVNCGSTVTADSFRYYVNETCPLSIQPQTCYHYSNGMHQRGELALQ